MEEKVTIPTPVGATPVITLDTLNITDIHNEGYISKEMLGEALGLSNKAIKKAKRSDLIEKMRSKLLESKEEETMAENNTVQDVAVTDKVRKMRDMLNRIMYAKTRNLEKGYGSVISIDMLNDAILKQFGVTNVKNALKHDMRVKEDMLLGKPTEQKIIVTDELIRNVIIVKSWLIKYHYISEEVRYVENKDEDGNVKYKLPVCDVLDGPIQ
jgi:hypothetical protein